MTSSYLTLKFNGHKVYTLVMVVSKFQVFALLQVMILFKMIERKIPQKSNEHHLMLGFKIIKIRGKYPFFCLE